MHLERQYERPAHDSRSGVERHFHAGIVLICRNRVVSLGTHAHGAVSAGIPPVANTSRCLVRLPVVVFEGSQPPVLRETVKFCRLRSMVVVRMRSANIVAGIAALSARTARKIRRAYLASCHAQCFRLGAAFS